MKLLQVKTKSKFISLKKNRMLNIRLLFSLSIFIILNSFAQDPCGEMDLLSVNDTIICNDESIVIFANNGFQNYNWNTDASTQGINISFPGNYTVTSSFFTNNLVTNGDFNAGNTDFNSSYNYSATNLYPEGVYAVTTNANFVHNGFTGTGAGNFLVVNGSTSPGTEVWCQDIQVESASSYNFSSLVSTVAGGNEALLQFSINGVEIGTTFSAPSIIGSWDTFNASWESGTNTVAEICIVNQNIGGGGNDFGLDNITFTTLCTASETINVTLGAQANATIFSVNTLCETGSIVDLNAVDQGGVWTGNGIINSTTGLFSPASAGDGEHLISYTISSACGATDTVIINVVEEIESNITAVTELCSNNTPILIEGLPGPGTWSGAETTGVNTGVFNPQTAEIGENIITYIPSIFCATNATHSIEVHALINPNPELVSEICFGQTSELNLGEGEWNSYLWSTTNTSSSITVNISGEYAVEFSDSNECVQEIIFTVLDKDDCELITMPNVFTPNNDLSNDFFIPIEYEFISQSTIKIFNRWGAVVWNTNEIEKGWNGKHFNENCSEGVYFWLIDYKTNKDVYKTISGNVSLFR